MLEDAGGRLGEHPDQPQGAVEVQEVVVGKFLAVKHLGGREIGTPGVRIDVEGRLLVRVLSIAERLPKRKGEVRATAGNFAAGLSPALRDPGEVVGDRPVVGARPRERGLGQPAAGLERRASRGLKLVEERGILIGIGQDGDVLVILGRGPDQRGTADVDVLDGVLERRRRVGHRRLERVEVHDHEVDRVDRLAGQDLQVLGHVRVGPGSRRGSGDAGS